MQTWIRALAGLVVLSTIVPAAHARPDYCEQGDTNDLPLGAQPAEGEGPLERLNGNIEGFGVRGADQGDMYLVDISDPENFMLRLVAGGGVRPQLWLFAGPGLTSYPEGVGLLANNGVGLGYEGALLLNESTDGTGIVLTEPGFYYVAVTGQAPTDSGGAGRVPQGRNPGLIADIFEFGPGFEISGPDGPGGALPIFRWRDDGDEGIYSIEAQGVTLIPNGCTGDINGDGVVNFGDILIVLANWGPCDPPLTCVLEEDFDSFIAGLPLIPQQPCFPTCPPDFSWQAWDDNPYGGGALVFADPDPSQNDNALGINGNDDIVHTFNGLTSGQYIFRTDVYVPAGAYFDMAVSLPNSYSPGVGANFSLRLVLNVLDGTVTDVDSGAKLGLVLDTWVELSVLIDLDNDVQTVFYDNEVLVVKSWTEGATGEGDLNIAGVRLRATFAGDGTRGPVADGFFDDFAICPLMGPPPCDGDADDDNIVGFADLLLILAQWGDCP